MGLFDGNLKEAVLKRVEDSKQDRLMAQEESRASKEQFKSTMKTVGVTKILTFILIEDSSTTMPIQSNVTLHVLKDNSILMSYTKTGSFATTYNASPYNFIDFDWIEDIQNKGKKVVGRSIVGAMLAGPAGMIIGGVTGKKKTKDNSIAVITLQNKESHELIMLSFECPTKTAIKYKSIPKMPVIEDKSLMVEIETESEPDALDQLKKLKELLDMDAITQQEFDNKKQELLGDM